jgi:hypothetical protein
LGFKKKGFKPSRFKNPSKSSRMSLPSKSMYQQNFPSQSGNTPFREAPSKTNNTKREPLKCWGCGEEHLLRGCSHRQQNPGRVYNIQEATTVNDVARSLPQIYVALDNRQDDHQDSMMDMECMISNHHVSILIDPGSNLSYVSPQIVEKSKLQQVKHVKSWPVQLATGTKRKVVEFIPACQFVMSGFPTQVNLNILPLGSYDLLIGMDGLAAHKTKLDYYIKTLECENEEGRRVTLQGIQKHVSVRQISSLQVKKYCRKGCPLYTIQVLNIVENDKPNLENHTILREYKYVFP